jgi:hypothetical protein
MPPIFRRKSWADPEWYEAIERGVVAEVDQDFFVHFWENAIDGAYLQDELEVRPGEKIKIAFMVSVQLPSGPAMVAFWKEGEGDESRGFASRVSPIAKDSSVALAASV